MTSYRSGHVVTSAQHIGAFNNGTEAVESMKYLNRPEGVSQSNFRNSVATGLSDTKGAYKLY